MTIFLALAFIIELVAFAGFASASLFIPVQSFLQVIIGIALLIVLIAFWSIYMAPRAPKKFDIKRYYIAKGIIYTIASLTLFNFYGVGFGLVFVGVTLVDEIILFRHNLTK